MDQNKIKKAYKCVSPISNLKLDLKLPQNVHNVPGERLARNYTVLKNNSDNESDTRDLFSRVSKIVSPRGAETSVHYTCR